MRYPRLALMSNDQSGPNEAYDPAISGIFIVLMLVMTVIIFALA
jgi:hypothetical protein